MPCLQPLIRHNRARCGGWCTIVKILFLLFVVFMVFFELLLTYIRWCWRQETDYHQLRQVANRALHGCIAILGSRTTAKYRYKASETYSWMRCSWNRSTYWLNATESWTTSGIFVLVVRYSSLENNGLKRIEQCEKYKQLEFESQRKYQNQFSPEELSSGWQSVSAIIWYCSTLSWQCQD